MMEVTCYLLYARNILYEHFMVTIIYKNVIPNESKTWAARRKEGTYIERIQDLRAEEDIWT